MSDEPPKSTEFIQPIPLEYESPRPRPLEYESPRLRPPRGLSILGFPIGFLVACFFVGLCMIMAGMMIDESTDKSAHPGARLIAMAVICGGFVTASIRWLMRNRRKSPEKRMAAFDAGFLAGVCAACTVSGVLFILAAIDVFGG